MSAQQDGTVVQLDEDWEEWDGRSPFWAHCMAGSLAGVAEHAAIYPLDTVRTHIQGMYAARFVTRERERVCKARRIDFASFFLDLIQTHE